MREVVKAIIYNNGKYLLQLRDNKSFISYPNMWSLFGGEIEKGESKIEALNRELKDELGWYPYKVDYLNKSSNYEDKCSVFYYHADFYVKYKKLILGEGQAMKWFTVDEAQNLIHTKDSINAIKYFEKFYL